MAERRHALQPRWPPVLPCTGAGGAPPILHLPPQQHAIGRLAATDASDAHAAGLPPDDASVDGAAERRLLGPAHAVQGGLGRACQRHDDRRGQGGDAICGLDGGEPDRISLRQDAGRIQGPRRRPERQHQSGGVAARPQALEPRRAIWQRGPHRQPDGGVRQGRQRRDRLQGVRRGPLARQDRGQRRGAGARGRGQAGCRQADAFPPALLAAIAAGGHQGAAAGRQPHQQSERGDQGGGGGELALPQHAPGLPVHRRRQERLHLHGGARRRPEEVEHTGQRRARAAHEGVRHRRQRLHRLQ
mmetsp:Transcript_25826/g.61651  ORF Transcript_25826/g.61651 Transcript_25826/m.61651 type:complete len:301 (+) Transcript_25826:448-1350(+)